MSMQGRIATSNASVVLHTGTMSTSSDVYNVHLIRTVQTIVLVGRPGMHKTGCSGEIRTVLHISSSS